MHGQPKVSVTKRSASTCLIDVVMILKLNTIESNNDRLDDAQQSITWCSTSTQTTLNRRSNALKPCSNCAQTTLKSTQMHSSEGMLSAFERTWTRLSVFESFWARLERGLSVVWAWFERDLSVFELCVWARLSDVSACVERFKANYVQTSM